MPRYTFTSPEGKTYDIDGPEGSTKEQAFGVLQQQIGAGTAKSTAPPPPQSAAGFVGGNIAKGVAQTVGSYAEKARELVNLPGDIANRVLESVLGKKAPAVPKAAPTAVGPEELTAAGEKAGAIGPSAEPRTTGQRYAAAALQALPAAALPGAGTGVLGRVAPAVGAGLGGEAGRQLGGETGAFLGSLLGGAAGGAAAGARQAAIPKPPSEAARASQASGIPLTLGQETGSKALQFSENRLKELFPSKGVAAADELRQVAAGVNRVTELADQVSKRATADPEAIGNQLRTAYKDTVTKLDKMRDTQAKTDYGAVRKAAGDQKVIGYKNTLDELDKIITENKGVPPGGDAAKIAAQATAIRDFITKQGTATVGDAMKTRSAWGKAARRTGNVFSDIDPNANQVLAKRLFGAVNRDFDAASTANTPIASLLKTANANYAKASQSLDFVQKSALGKLLGEDVVDALGTGATASTKAPEAIAKRYLTMTPSEARSVTNILEQHAPEALQDAKSFVLRNGLEQAKNEAPGAPPISFGKFRREMDKVAPKLKEMGFTPKEIADIKDVTDTMARAGDRTGVNPSGTTGAAHMLSIPALAVTHPLAAVGAVVTPYVASRALLTPQGRDLLRQAYTATDNARRNAALGALRSYGVTAATLGQNPPAPLMPQSPAGSLGLSAPPAQ